MSENPLTDDPTRVFLLIENRLVRQTLVRLFRKRSDLCVVGESSATEEIEIRGCPCDILVLDDIQMLAPVTASLLNEQGGKAAPGIVLIGMEEDEEQFLLAVRSGIAGYLLNDASASDVVTAVRAAARGEAVCPPRLCLALFHAMAKLSRDAPPAAKSKCLPCLTIRQQQLISLVAQGLTNKEIAMKLNLSEFTIKNHMHRIMKQVEAASRSAAVEAARASGYSLVV